MNVGQSMINASCLLSVLLIGCHALQTLPSHTCGPRHYRPIRSARWPSHHHRRYLPLSVTASEHDSNIGGGGGSINDDDDETLLESVDPSTLQNLCEEYSLPTTGEKREMLGRLREFAERQAAEDRERRRGRAGRVEANLEGTKARHTIVDQDAFAFSPQGEDDDDDDDGGYFYYAAAETKQEKERREEEERQRRRREREKSRSSSGIAVPPPPEDAPVNEKGERVVTVYSTTDKNDLTGATAQNPMSDMSLDSARYRQRSIGADQPERSLAGGPFGTRKKADAGQFDNAKEDVTRLVRELLATTGAPAFQDDYEEGDEIIARDGGGSASPYEFTGFRPEVIPPALLSKSSWALRANGGKVLKEILSEYELQAIGHDGMAADDRSKGGGHYREAEKVGSFLEGYRKAEERRVARATSTMLLDRLVKEGVKGLDTLLAGMVREGEDDGSGSGGYVGVEEGGELNGALVRYLEEAIREQEQRVKRTPNVDDGNAVLGGKKPQGSSGADEDDMDLMWNVTRGEDGTIIETIDPNSPAVGRMLREELEKTEDGDNGMGDGSTSPLPSSMTVQEKMLLLLKLLRDRVKVEAVVGNDAHARNLRILAYCLNAANDEERQKLITDELGNSLDSLDIFSDLLTASMDYAEARSNDDFMPGNRPKGSSPVLDVSKLQKIKVDVERIKANQSWKASGISSR